MVIMLICGIVCIGMMFRKSAGRVYVCVSARCDVTSCYINVIDDWANGVL